MRVIKGGKNSKWSTESFFYWGKRNCKKKSYFFRRRKRVQTTFLVGVPSRGIIPLPILQLKNPFSTPESYTPYPPPLKFLQFLAYPKTANRSSAALFFFRNSNTNRVVEKSNHIFGAGNFLGNGKKKINGTIMGWEADAKKKRGGEGFPSSGCWLWRGIVFVREL